MRKKVGNSSIRPQDMNLPGYRLHEHSSREKGTWAVWVSGNWRASVSPEMAVRVGLATKTSPESWLYMQAKLDLWFAGHELKEIIKGTSYLIH